MCACVCLSVMNFRTVDVCWNHVKREKGGASPSAWIQNKITEKYFHFHTLGSHTAPLPVGVSHLQKGFLLCKLFANVRVGFFFSRSAFSFFPFFFLSLCAIGVTVTSLPKIHAIWIIIIKWLWLPQFIYLFFSCLRSLRLFPSTAHRQHMPFLVYVAMKWMYKCIFYSGKK